MTAPGSTSPLYATFSRADVAFERGEGAWLIDSRGESWLDFGSGIAVNALGHAHPHLVETLKAQAEKVWHVSNAFRIPDQERLAERLVANTFADRCFFTNSGAEALECAFKTVRRYHWANGHPERFRIITMEGAFHGRTLATIAASARVMSRYVDAMMIRILDVNALHELAEYATVPVINGLTKVSHPTQVMADIMTYEEHRGSVKGKTFAWTGDGNNVLNSLVHAAARFGYTMRIATPKELAPSQGPIDWARANGGRIEVTNDPFEAVDGADAIFTDTWVSMGDEEGERRRHNLLTPYQVNDRLMAAADKDAVFMHCLPAHRGDEVTSSVMDGPRSIVFDEAENRLHAHKGILAWCFGAMED